MTEITSEANISQGERVANNSPALVDHPIETVENPGLANLVRSSIDGREGTPEETAPTRKELVSTRDDLSSYESNGVKHNDTRHWLSRLTRLGSFMRPKSGASRTPVEKIESIQGEPLSSRSPDAFEKIRQGGWEDRARANLAALYRELVEERGSQN